MAVQFNSSFSSMCQCTGYIFIKIRTKLKCTTFTCSLNSNYIKVQFCHFPPSRKHSSTPYNFAKDHIADLSPLVAANGFVRF